MLTNSKFRYIINIEKGKTSNGHAKEFNYFSNNAIASVGWRYFTFIVNVIKNTIVKNKILNM